MPVRAPDRVIRWTTAGAVVGVAAVAAVTSCEHAYALVRAHGEAGLTGRLVPLTVDGLIYASSMMMPDSARRKVLVSPLARWLLGLGIAATRSLPTRRLSDMPTRLRSPGRLPGDHRVHGAQCYVGEDVPGEAHRQVPQGRLGPRGGLGQRAQLAGPAHDVGAARGS